MLIQAVEKDKSISAIFKELGISNQTLYSMRYPDKTIGKAERKCGCVSLEVIDKLCSYFKCQPSDLMELSDDN